MTVYSVDKNIYEGLPYKFRCRVHGKYDEEFYNTSPNYTNKEATDLTDYNGFSYTPERKVLVNVTQVNNPTITDDGVVSGCNASNYLKLRDAFLPESSAWEIVWKVKTGSSVTTEQYLFGSSTGFYNTVGGEMNASGKFGIGFSSNGSSWDIGWLVCTTTLTTNTWYWLKISFTGTEYKVELSTDGETYTLENSVTSSTPIYQNASTSIMHLGTMGDKSKYWQGSIDLKECSIKTASQYFPDAWTTVWSGIQHTQAIVYDFSNTVLPWKWDYQKQLQTSRYVLDASNQTKTYYGNSIVGTINGTLTTVRAYVPSISGFSNSNYLTMWSAWNVGSSEWKVHFKVITGASTATDKYICGQSSSSANMGSPQIAINGTTIKIWLSSNKSSWNIASAVACSIAVEPNTTHDIELKYTGEAYKVLVDGVEGLSITSTTPVYSGTYPFILGFDHRNTAFNGSVLLQDSYIEVDGEEVWRGVKKETVPSMAYGKTIGSTNNVYVINGNESLSAESTSVTRTTNATNPRFLGTVPLVQ